ncbi:CAAX amino terminal protease family protein [Sulfitobacter noctilucicola]|uniref:CAAX prenyl protease 2/Lysostaphin resistance protein A-like domain-containing protein n=1 Tax=Sulfitobacter noctilucicola TaxID=1342301 RepID=A0A7W6Q3Z8_9RHOB|nr:type II CAAX endopeptidase family protein [Sulfitobacter noctilucicola]KIN63071.1 CAAX amino terminal protease family protein [Sulfitobacter noctilucicola]MBB4172402.1 hypothetical protein [Sulfitobacter noctilucicola]
MNPNAYAAHAAFIAPARARSEAWRLVAGLVLAFFAYVMLNQIFFQVVLGLTSAGGGGSGQDWLWQESAPAMYVLLFSFAFMSVGAGLSVRLLHDRSFASLLGPKDRLRRDFRATFVMVAGITLLIFIAPPWDMGADYVPNMPLGKWLVLFVPSLFFILIQTSAEEIVFRGYVQQQLAARFDHPLIWMVLPSVLFALGHYLPDMAGENAIWIAVWAGLFGILMADLTARSGSLGPAIAVHFINNVSAFMFISLPDEMTGLALYLTPFGMDDPAILRTWLPVDFAMMIVLWLAARLAIRR